MQFNNPIERCIQCNIATIFFFIRIIPSIVLITLSFIYGIYYLNDPCSTKPISLPFWLIVSACVSIYVLIIEFFNIIVSVCEPNRQKKYTNGILGCVGCFVIVWLILGTISLANAEDCKKSSYTLWSYSLALVIIDWILCCSASCIVKINETQETSNV